MSTDHQLAIKLAADASELKRAQAEGAAGFERLGQAGKQAGAEASAGAKQATTATQAEAAAVVAASRQAAEARMAEQVAMRSARAEANLLKQANRQLAMQMTDVVTSVASGMPLWMVAIQQGGQVRDAYGGIVPAGRAVIGMLSPLTVALGGTALAMGAVVLAYNQGAGEVQAFARALAMTGGASGTTVDNLQGMAASMAATSTATRGAAAEVLAMAASSGRVAAPSLRLVAEAALELQRVAGVSVADTVAQFAALGRDPVAASIKLNGEVNHLTVAVYEQIRSLQQQGKIAEAAAVAQSSYAEAVKLQSAEIETRLGALERMWNGVGVAAAKAWDFMRGIGRQSSAQEELALLEKQLAMPEQRGGNAIEVSKRRAAAQARADELRMQIYMEGEAAAAQQARAESTDKHIRTQGERDRAAKAAADNAKREADARRSAELAGLRNAAQAESAANADAQRLLQAQRQAGLVSEEAYFASRRQLIQRTASDEVAALDAENRRLMAEKLTGAEKIKRDQEVANNKAEAARVQARASTDMMLADIDAEAAVRRLSLAQADYVRNLQQANAARGLANGRDLGSRRLGDGAREAAGREAAIADQFNQARQQLEADLANNKLGRGSFEDRLAALRAYYDQALQQEADYQEQRAALEANANVGFDRALANYAEQSRNVAEQSERAWTRAFSGMEDAIVRFATTGKLSFSDLANSIIADLIRIYLRQQLTGLFSTGMENFMNWRAGGSTGFGNDAPFGGVGRVMHGGGKVGTDAPMATRWMPDSTWASAPRFHSGRLGSNEMAAILEKDESVLTPAQMRQLAPAGGTSQAQINLQLSVVNQTGQAVNATARQTQGGGIEVLLTAAQTAMAGDVSQGRGDMYVALKTRFNLRD